MKSLSRLYDPFLSFKRNFLITVLCLHKNQVNIEHGREFLGLKNRV